MDKLSVRGKLIELANEELQVARQAYSEHLEASKRVSDESTVPDEQAQAWTQADIAQSLEEPMRAAEAKLAAMEEIDFGPKDSVEPGAIVTVDGNHYVIAIATDNFTCEGIELMGLSPLAPISKAIQGREKSDTVDFRGNTLRIENVL